MADDDRRAVAVAIGIAVGARIIGQRGVRHIGNREGDRRRGVIEAADGYSAITVEARHTLLAARRAVAPFTIDRGALD